VYPRQPLWLTPLLQTSDLRHLTYELALEQGVTTRARARVTSIDLKNRSVTLASGETLSADVLIGADGLYGVSRATLRNGESEECRRTGMVIYEYAFLSSDSKTER
jgi:salicylate hydroxylase